MESILSDELRAKIAQFPNEEDRARINNCNQLLAQFLEKYPFKKDPTKIDELTPDDVYNKGGDYFFKWIEHKLKTLGHLTIGSAAYLESARDNIDTLKMLLKIVVDDSKTIAQKVDAGWDEIPWFGGDRHIAKKIIYLYNFDKTLPMFKTEDMEYFATKMGLNYEKSALAKYGKGYGLLSLGQKYELLTELLLEPKPKSMDHQSWGFFYYTVLGTPPREKVVWGGGAESKETRPLNSIGLLFEPEYEQEVVYLFSILHRELGFPYIVHISDAFPDATALDNQKNLVKIEFELRASGFDHPLEGANYIICWENDLTTEQIPEKFPKIIALKDYLEQEK